MNTKPFAIFLTTLVLCAAAVIGCKRSGMPQDSAIAASAAGAMTDSDRKEQTWHLADGTKTDREEVVKLLVKHLHLVEKVEAEFKVANRRTNREEWETKRKKAFGELPQPLQGAMLDGFDLTDAVTEAANRQKSSEPNRIERLDLSECSLVGATLRGLELDKVSLAYAMLSGANMEGVHMNDVNLTGADLSFANFDHAEFDTVEAPKADWCAANLTEASFKNSMLNDCGFDHVVGKGLQLSGGHAAGATFESADLTGAKIHAGDFGDADFEDGILSQVSWGASGKPDLGSLFHGRNLETLTYEDSETALVELRKYFMEAGIRSAERKVNYALQHARTEHLRHDNDASLADRAEAFLREVCFDWTCQYGLVPGRPLKIIALLILVFTFPYAWVLIRPQPRKNAGTPGKTGRGGQKDAHAAERPDSLASKALDGSVTGIRYAQFGEMRTGIWAVPLDKRVQEGATEPVLLHVDLGGRGKLRGGWRALRLGFFFSLVSAFSTGYRDLDVGRWIERIKHDESTLRGTGWVRTLSGLQSLISFVMLALWLLTYFGRPFE